MLKQTHCGNEERRAKRNERKGGRKRKKRGGEGRRGKSARSGRKNTGREWKGEKVRGDGRIESKGEVVCVGCVGVSWV